MVHVDGHRAFSCQTPASILEGRSMDMIDGLSDGVEDHAIQRAWIEEQVPQCGYRQPGMIMSGLDLLQSNPAEDASFDSATALASLVDIANDLSVEGNDVGNYLGEPGDSAVQALEEAGAVIQHLGAALRERVSFTDGQVDQSNYFDYRIMRMAQAPEVEVYFEPSYERPRQVADGGARSIVPAVANALHDLTGVRLRHLPLNAERVLAALA